MSFTLVSAVFVQQNWVDGNFESFLKIRGT